MLPGGLGTIVPASVQILNAPAWYSDPYGANIAVTATSVGWEIDTQTCPGGCDNIFDYLKPRDIGHVSLPLAIGDSQFYGNLQGWVVGGGGPLGIYNPEGGLTIVTTPEPNSGLMLAYAFYWVR